MNTDEREAGRPEEFWKAIEGEVRGCTDVQDAAQLFCERFYSTFVNTAVLVRLFATLDYKALGLDDRRYAFDYAARVGGHDSLVPSTPVLTLLGTFGIEMRWRDRITSRDHRAIPLLSNEFVADAPMISRLLGSIGFSPIRSEPIGAQFVSRSGIAPDGLFYVRDAGTTTDDRGRLIIPSTEFVDRYRVKTVFGVGGRYERHPIYLAAIVFARDEVARSRAAMFLDVIGHVKECTQHLIDQGALFRM